jgi:hypothetical protein
MPRRRRLGRQSRHHAWAAGRRRVCAFSSGCGAPPPLNCQNSCSSAVVQRRMAAASWHAWAGKVARHGARIKFLRGGRARDAICAEHVACSSWLSNEECGALRATFDSCLRVWVVGSREILCARMKYVRRSMTFTFGSTAYMLLYSCRELRKSGEGCVRGGHFQGLLQGRGVGL